VLSDRDGCLEASSLTSRHSARYAPGMKTHRLAAYVRNTWLFIWSMMAISIVCMILCIVETYRMHAILERVNQKLDRMIERR
jgi:hypothetical protein